MFQTSCQWNVKDHVCEWKPTELESNRLNSDVFKHITEQSCGWVGSQLRQVAACWPLDQTTCKANHMCQWHKQSSMKPVGSTCVETDTSYCSYDFLAWKNSFCGDDCSEFYAKILDDQCSHGTVDTCSSISDSTCMWNYKENKCEQPRYLNYPTSCRGFRDSARLSGTCDRIADQAMCVASPSCEWTSETKCSDDKATPHTF